MYGEKRQDLDMLLLWLISLGFKLPLPEVQMYRWSYEYEYFAQHLSLWKRSPIQRSGETACGVTEAVDLGAWHLLGNTWRPPKECHIHPWGLGGWRQLIATVDLCWIWIGDPQMKGFLSYCRSFDLLCCNNKYPPNLLELPAILALK